MSPKQALYNFIMRGNDKGIPFNIGGFYTAYIIPYRGVNPLINIRMTYGEYEFHVRYDLGKGSVLNNPADWDERDLDRISAQLSCAFQFVNNLYEDFGLYSKPKQSIWKRLFNFIS